jgi:amidase
MGMEYVTDIHGLDSLRTFAALNVKREDIAESWNKLWAMHGLDAVMGPGAQNSAVEHDAYNMPPYTVFLNLLDVRSSLPTLCVKRVHATGY